MLTHVDMPTQYGSDLYRDHRSGYDSSAVGIIRAAGAIIFGSYLTFFHHKYLMQRRQGHHHGIYGDQLWPQNSQSSRCYTNARRLLVWICRGSGGLPGPIELRGTNWGQCHPTSSIHGDLCYEAITQRDIDRRPDYFLSII